MVVKDFDLKINTYTLEEKFSIASFLKPIPELLAIKDFYKLKDFDYSNIGISRVGNNAVDKFTFCERLNTRGNKNISFFDFYFNRNLYKNKKYIKNVIDFLNDDDNIKKWKDIFNLYFGCISLFRPLVAMEIYNIYNPTTILDFTAGWGGRLIGAMALNVPEYIGIDNNYDLEKPYSDMIDFYKEHTSTKTTMIFDDALNIDYSKLKYDMVLTSPPYYNKEIYGKSEQLYKHKKDWNEKFYIPLFRRVFDGLSNGGIFCLNVPVEIYDKVLLPMFGVCNSKISLKKVGRKLKNISEEFIYIWYKIK